MTLTGYHQKTDELIYDLVMHGGGELKFEVLPLKDNTVKIVVTCGRSYAYFIKKDYQDKFDEIL